MTAREEMLGRLRQALAGSGPAPSAAPEAIPRTYRGADPTDAAGPGAAGPGAGVDVTDLLAERLSEHGATVTPCSADDAGRVVAAVLTGWAAGRVLAPAGLDRELLGEWADGPDREVLIDSVAEPLPVAVLDGADAVVTACAVAVAETGTLVLDGSPDQGRRALTLVPDRHLVVVRVGQVVASVPQAVHALDPRRARTWVSGPAATSDIELSRVVGVHGPRTLAVVLVTTG